MDQLFLNLVQLSHCFSNAPQSVFHCFFSGTEDLRAFSTSSVDKAHLVDVCIKLRGGISRCAHRSVIGVASCKINKIINS